jgi:hypothetical protein
MIDHKKKIKVENHPKWMLESCVEGHGTMQIKTCLVAPWSTHISKHRTKMTIFFQQRRSDDKILFYMKFALTSLSSSRTLSMR